MSEIPLILNIETATEICSVCISRGEEVLSLKEPDGSNDHSKLITTLIDACLKEAGLKLSDLNAVAVSSGPGSYTSLRVGVSTAKGICFAQEIPLIAVDTLQSLAMAACREGGQEGALYCPMIDARRMEVYCAIFDQENTVVEKTSAKIITEESFQTYFNAGQRIIFMGNGAKKCQPILRSPHASFLTLRCSARYLSHFSYKAFLEKSFADLAYFTPNYLKAPNITTSKQKLFK